MERTLINSPFTAKITFYENGVIVDPATVTVTITRADGTAIVTGSSTGGTGANPRTLDLTAVQLATLDMLTLTWVSASKGTRVTHLEVVGGFLFTLAEAQARTALAGLGADVLAAGRVLAETALEDAYGAAFVPRYHRETKDGKGHTLLHLTWPKITAVRSVTVDGTAYTSGQLADIKITEGGGLYNPVAWRRHGNIVLGYEHGDPFPPARASNAALMLLERWRASQPADERVISASVDNVSFRLAIAGTGGQPFDVPEANAVVGHGGHRMGIA